MFIQLDLFNKYTEEELLREEIRLLKNQIGNVRKGLFARHNQLAKEFMRLREELEVIKFEMDKLKNNLTT